MGITQQEQRMYPEAIWLSSYHGLSYYVFQLQVYLCLTRQIAPSLKGEASAEVP